MIKYISSWAEQIIIAIVVVSIIEMILPKGNSKKYIKTMIGVYILYTIISPAIKLITGGDLKIDYSKYEKYFNTAEASSNIDTSSIENTYKRELEKKIKSDVEEMGYKVKKIHANLDLEIGSITEVIIIVDEEKKNSNTIDISINQISIGSKYEDNKLSVKEVEEIKQKISESYSVDIKYITVNSI